MTTIKSYTDIEQSKKLAEILLLESADMSYLSDDSLFPKVNYNGMVFFNSEEEKPSALIPCWSLAALLDVIPGGQVNKMTDSDKWEACSWNDFDFEPQIYVEEFDNPIDACYELIIRLNELNLL